MNPHSGVESREPRPALGVPEVPPGPASVTVGVDTVAWHRSIGADGPALIRAVHDNPNSLDEGITHMLAQDLTQWMTRCDETRTPMSQEGN
jgi:predicted nucleic acid-binding Zn ribbon protein